jgi:hypothetical protein
MNLTAAEFERLEQKAKEAGVAMAVYVRRVSLGGEVVARLGPEDREMFRAVVSVSNALNGLYELARAGGAEGGMDSFAMARDEVDGLLKKLKL